MTPSDFRRLALDLPDTEEGSHFGAVDFRTGGRIFATLAMVDQGYGNLLLSPALQHELIANAPQLFLPVPGGWGRMGATHIRLAPATEDELAGALHTAWKLRTERNAATGKKSPKPKSTPLHFVMKKPAPPKAVKKAATKKAARKKSARKTPAATRTPNAIPPAS